MGGAAASLAAVSGDGGLETKRQLLRLEGAPLQETLM